MKGKEQKSEGSTSMRDFQKLWAQVRLLWIPRWKELHDPESWSRCQQHQEKAALVQDTVTNRHFRYFYTSLQLLQISQKIIIIRTVAHQAPLSMEFSRQENWSWQPFLLQGIFPTQGSDPSLLHCWQILYHLSHQRSPYSSPCTSKLWQLLDTIT